MSNAFPELTLATPRLLLRPFGAEDTDAVAAATADPAVRRWTHGRRGCGDERAVFREGRGAVYAVACREDGRFAGQVSATRVDWEAQTAEVGYWLAAGARGNGYATEAVRELCRWLFTLGFARVTVTVPAGNVAAAAVADRAGFTWEARLPAATVVAEPAEHRRADAWLFGLVAGGDAQPRFPAVRLRTPRLLLRPFAAVDADEVEATMTDEISLRWLTVRQPYTRTMAEQWCTDLAHEGRYSGDGVSWAARTEAEGAFVGSFSLKRTDWRNRVTEVGYVVAPGARGRGYATEAVREVARWALDDRGGRMLRVELRAAVGNAASRRVAEKAGFAAEGVLRDGGYTHGGQVDLALYGLTRRDVS